MLSQGVWILVVAAGRRQRKRKERKKRRSTGGRGRGTRGGRGGRTRRRRRRGSSEALKDALEFEFRGAVGKGGEIVIVGRDFHEPFGFDFDVCADEILGREDEFVVQNPRGLRVETTTRMQRDDLHVLDGEIVARALEMSDLHEETLDDRLSDVLIIRSVCKIGAVKWNLQFHHYSTQLFSHTIS